MPKKPVKPETRIKQLETQLRDAEDLIASMRRACRMALAELDEPQIAPLAHRQATINNLRRVLRKAKGE